MHELEVVLRINVDTDEQVQKIMDSVMSGYASELVKMGALWGAFQLGGGQVSTAHHNPVSHTSATSDNITLKRVDDGDFSINVSDVEDTVEEQPKRSKGIAGRKRMGRG